MAAKYMSASSGGEIPDADSAIRRTANQDVFACCKRPNTTLVALKGSNEIAGNRGVYVDGMVV
jgi:hypothetical protein